MKSTESVRRNAGTESRSKKYEIDMCNGPLFRKIIIFALPLMASSVLQLMFNAADMIVVGRFSGSNALAAVGSTASINNLIVNFFIGLSVGTNVMAARYYGARKQKELSDTVHTAVLTAMICGVFLCVLGISVSRPALTYMGTPEEVINQSVLYMRITFLGVPFMLLYNFGSAVLRALGDTRRPLYILFAAGVVNVLLNLITVIVFYMGVAGVAIATVSSHIISSALVLRCLVRSESAKLELKNLRIIPAHLLDIIKIGMPAGIQSVFFGISNVLIQSSVNSFGAIAMAGNTASQNIEGFIATGMSAFYQAAISFTGQNYGARKIRRIARVALICEGMALMMGVLVGNIAILFSDQLLGLYSSDPAVIEYGGRRLAIMASFYFLAGMMDVIVGLMRGMGHAIVPMFVTLTGACLFRIVWLNTVFLLYRTPECLYSSYPISWALTGVVQLLCFLFVYRKIRRQNPEQEE